MRGEGEVEGKGESEGVGNGVRVMIKDGLIVVVRMMIRVR